MAKVIANAPQTTAPRRTLKQLIQSGEVFVGGIVAEYMRPSIFKLYRHAGFDFGFVECEHVWFEPTMLAASILTARDIGLPLIAKVSQLDRAEIAKLLEAGISGIQLPRTESRADVERLRDYIKFAPLGSRAIALGYGSSDYIQSPAWRTWMDEQNDATALVVHIETRAGYEHAEQIIATEGVDLVYLGPGDFSISMGHAGDYDHPDVAGPMNEILAICRRYGIPFGTTASGIDAAQRWIAKGARFFETMDELTMITNEASRLVRQYREAANSAATI